MIARRGGGRGFLLLAYLLGASALLADEPKQSVLVVVGAEGSSEFAPQFRAWAEKWQAAAEQGQAEFAAIGLETTVEKPDRDLLRERITAWAGVATPAGVARADRPRHIRRQNGPIQPPRR